ncbi:MAG: hypothetical protein WCL50_18465, partial [Spirochaetota bacterium]
MRDIFLVGGSLELGTPEILASPERATVLGILVEEGTAVKVVKKLIIVSDNDLGSIPSQERTSLQKLLRDMEQAERDRVATLLERKLAA